MDAVVVAGDLFDAPRPSKETLAVARETFRRIAADGAPVILVPGNQLMSRRSLPMEITAMWLERHFRILCTTYMQI